MPRLEGRDKSRGLVLVFCPAGSPRTAGLLDALDPVTASLELQIVHDLAVLEVRLAEIRPDVIVLEVTELHDEAIGPIGGVATSRGPTIVVDGRPSLARQDSANEAGAAAYLDAAAAAPRELARLVGCAFRSSTSGLAVEETRQHLLDILESSSDGIFVLVDGLFYFVNSVFARALAAEPQHLADRALLDFVTPSERERVREELSRLEVQGGMRELVDIPLTGGDVTTRYEVAVRTSVIDNHRALVGIARDVTAERELEREIERARQRMAQVERLRALGEMAAGVAHDFNNAIGAVLGRTVLARQKLERGEPVRDDLDVIELAAQDASEVVQRIRDFSRPSSDGWQDLDLGALLEDGVALIRTQVPSGVSVVLERGPTPLVRGNAGELREVLQNLLRNALDAVSAGGHVWARSFASAEHAVLEVQDDGPGVPDEVRQRIFEPFFTTKGEQGTGLGLSVSRWILGRHDAQLELLTTPGRGATFRLLFHPAITTVARAPEAPAQEGLSILVVDDDPSVAETIRDLLEDRGHHVLTATAPGDAAQLLGNVAVDLMVTDLDLPGMSGWQLARKVRELQPGIRVGLVTGWPLGASDQEVRARGVDFVLTKPFSAELLYATVEGAVRKKID